ncbi:hypothetical protein cand_036230 [Cryptosporidium andersoni]|uniref:Transcription factor 25 n=1 Tax=Cryptosporidium andersoni TaxID=117008 RepID=A0A1J4MX52_9CRYT|nr:hypothetical protein cand_036230 [Cryptosporidium andersoni]
MASRQYKKLLLQQGTKSFENVESISFEDSGISDESSEDFVIKNKFSALYTNSDTEVPDVDNQSSTYNDNTINTLSLPVLGYRKHPGKGFERDKYEELQTDDLEYLEHLTEQYNFETLNTNKTELSPYLKHCLTMNKQWFNCENEIRALFGAKVVTGSNKPHLHNRKKFSRSRHLNIRHYFIKGEDDWPHLSREVCGIKMQYNEEINQFYYTFDLDYIKKKDVFDALVDTHQVSHIYTFMAKNPFFFKGLIRLAEIHMLREEPELAFKYLQKSLYVFESSLHPLFSPFTIYNNKPRVSLNSSEAESKDIYLLLGSYMITLGSRGLFRTALEYAILLLSMDISHDRFHTLLHIDYYALCSSSHDFLFGINENFLKEYHSEISWKNYSSSNSRQEFLIPQTNNDLIVPISDILPNFAFSIPLALYRNYTKKFSEHKGLDTSIIFKELSDIKIEEILNNNYSLNNKKSCHIYLMKAILVFPEFIHFLLDKIAINQSGRNTPNPNGYSWNDILKNPIIIDFIPTNLPNSNDIPINQPQNEDYRYPYILMGKVLVEAYVEKCHELWKPAQTILWLHDCCSYLCKIYLESSHETKIRFGKFISDQRNILLKTHFNVFRYTDISITEFSKSGASLPQFLRENSYSGASNIRNTPNNSLFSVCLKSDPIIVYFQTLLPWSEVDLTGINATPIHLRSLIYDCFTAFKSYILSYFHRRNIS